ncbi:MAG TPA: hypothetical protein VJG65_01540 [Patescibacteria group bacterium]|nr:hypothetical protein [Patescibacteria group bacterium]
MFTKQKFDDRSVINFGFLGGIAEATYCFLVVLIINGLGKIFPDEPPMIFGFLLFLLIFVFSAAVSGLLVLGYPTYLAFQKRYPEAIMTLLITVVTLLIIGILVFLLLGLLI